MAPLTKRSTMGFTTEEINHIYHLAYHRDLNNVTLAFALIQGGPWISQWRTPLYWMFNRYLWAEQTQQAEEINVYYCQHTPMVAALPPLLFGALTAPPVLSLEVEKQEKTLGVDWSIMVHHLLHYGIPVENMREFIFRHGTPKIQRQVLPLFQSRSSSGIVGLNLGGLGLAQFPDVVLENPHIEHLELWGNQLQQLPDQWNRLSALAHLNLANNQLSVLPDSFLKLPQLERLYIQNNAFEWQDLLGYLRQMPQLQQLVAARTDEGTLRVLEELVQTGLHRQLEPLQDVFLALRTQQHLQPYPLPNTAVLLQALASGAPPLPLLVRQHLLQVRTTGPLLPFSSQASIAVLGLVTYATRLAIDTLAEQHHFTTQLTPQTTHILLGDCPQIDTPIENRPYLFLSEQQLQKLAQ